MQKKGSLVEDNIHNNSVQEQKNMTVVRWREYKRNRWKCNNRKEKGAAGNDYISNRQKALKA